MSILTTTVKLPGSFCDWLTITLAACRAAANTNQES